MSSSSETNLELLRLIWLDKFSDATQENRDIQDKLRSIVNNVQVFDNCQLCEHFLKYEINDQYDKIILIVSGQLGQQIMENIHQLRQIISIFVFCGDKQKNEIWAKNYPKIRNVIVEIEDLLKEIEIDIKSDEYQLNQSIQFLTNNFEIIDLLLQIPSDIISKRSFLNICFKYYENNRKQIETVEEFEHLYCGSSDALDYFFNRTFIYRLLIKALLTFNLEMIFLLRFYLKDIDEQLQMCLNYSSKVYFGQLMTIDQIEYLNNLNEKSIIQFNSFIITNKSQEKILNSLQNSSNTNGLHKVLFEINNNQMTKIYKDFLLFPLNTKFHFIEIKFEKRIWFVYLNVSNRNNSILNQKLNSIEFAHYCRNLGLLNQSEKLFYLLLNQYPTLNSQCYDGLGRIAQDKGLYEISLQFYFKSLENISLENRCHCLNNLGCIYDYLQQYDKAMEFYSQSLSLMKQDKYKAMCFNNMGITFAKIKQFDKAMEYFQNSLTIRKQILSENDNQIGISYTNIAFIYLANQQVEKALQYFYLGLNIFQLNKSNLFKAIVYQNMAEIFQQQNHFNKALQFYQDSLNIFKQFKPIDHPNIIFVQQQIQLIKQLK